MAALGVGAFSYERGTPVSAAATLLDGGESGQSGSKSLAGNTPGLLSRNVKRFRGGLVFQAHSLVYHSTLGLRVIKKQQNPPGAGKCRCRMQEMFCQDMRLGTAHLDLTPPWSRVEGKF